MASPRFPAWLAEERLGLAVSSYQAGKLFLVGLGTDGRLAVCERTLARCTGLWSDGQTLWLATAWQLWRFENVLPPGERERGRDRLFVPRLAHVTGDLDVHDVAVDDHGRPLFVNTLFSCLARPSERASFVPVWRPPFVSNLVPEDRCHLNGVALEAGQPRYVTAAAACDVRAGWRERRADGGVLVDVRSGETVLAGLSLPHSPRLHLERLWLHDSGRGFFGYADRTRGRFEPVSPCPGYARGLAFAGPWAVAGHSKPRGAALQGLALGDELSARGLEPRCGLVVIDLRSGEVAHWLRFEGVVEELYDVAILPGATRPAALGLRTDEARYTVTVEGERRLWRAAPATAPGGAA